MSRQPTCPLCGGHEFYELSSVFVRQRILKWGSDEEPAEYDMGEILWDTCESISGAFQCTNGCQIELDLEDLFEENDDAGISE
jgi:hypothetical protein